MIQLELFGDRLSQVSGWLDPFLFSFMTDFGVLGKVPVLEL